MGPATTRACRGEVGDGRATASSTTVVAVAAASFVATDGTRGFGSPGDDVGDLETRSFVNPTPQGPKTAQIPLGMS